MLLCVFIRKKKYICTNFMILALVRVKILQHYIFITSRDNVRNVIMLSIIKIRVKLRQNFPRSILFKFKPLNSNMNTFHIKLQKCLEVVKNYFKFKFLFNKPLFCHVKLSLQSEMFVLKHNIHFCCK